MLSKRAGNHTQSKLPCTAEELTLIKELIKGMESQIDCAITRKYRENASLKSKPRA